MNTSIVEQFLNCFNIEVLMDTPREYAKGCTTILEFERTDFDDSAEYWKGVCPTCGDVYEFRSVRRFEGFHLVGQEEPKPDYFTPDWHVS